MYENQDQELPNDFLCPILQDIMVDPVVTVDGHTFERTAIQDWFRRGKKTNPLTNQVLKSTTLTPNISIKRLIDEYNQKLPQKSKLRNQNRDLQETIKKLQQLWNQEISRQTPQGLQIQGPQIQGPRGFTKGGAPFKIDQIEEKVNSNNSSPQFKKKVKKFQQVPIKQAPKVFDNHWEKNMQSVKNRLMVWKNQYQKKKNSLNQVVKHSNRQQRGQFLKYGQLNGKCIIKWNNGDKLEGQYINGKPSGVGLMYFRNGNLFQGQFQDGIPHGKGIQHHHSGDRYQGDYQHGIKHGKGRYFFKDGAKYEGEFFKGQRHGQGVYYKISGSRFQGSFIHGKPSVGIKYYRDGSVKVIS